MPRRLRKGGRWGRLSGAPRPVPPWGKKKRKHPLGGTEAERAAARSRALRRFLPGTQRQTAPGGGRRPKGHAKLARMLAKARGQTREHPEKWGRCANPECRKDYRPKHKRKDGYGFCSDSCRAVAWRTRQPKRQRPAPTERSCARPSCPNTFMSVRANALYCGPKCRVEAHRARVRTGQRETRAVADMDRTPQDPNIESGRGGSCNQ